MAATAEENQSAAHPTYPEMILAAVSVLGEKGGSNQSAIIKFIGATYGERLGEDFTSEISYALSKLKDSGELVSVGSLFMKPDAVSTPHRGRGRPKKLKPTLPLEAVRPSPRPRGRPPKPKGLHAFTVKSDGGITPRRGRPAKENGSHAVSVKTTGGILRRRGRPAKPKDSHALTVKKAGGIPLRRGRPAKPKGSNALAVQTPHGILRRRGRPANPKGSHALAIKAASGISRRRGRPPKKHRPAVAAASSAGATVLGVKRGRGRPPKV